VKKEPETASPSALSFVGGLPYHRDRLKEMCMEKANAASMIGKRFPGEEDAIKQVIAYGEQYGYGNLINELRKAWYAMLKEKYQFDDDTAAGAVGFICVWCGVDKRTGKK
jgi:hypothetical protein